MTPKNTRASPTSSATSPRRKCRPTGTSSRATCRSPRRPTTSAKSQGYYDDNPGSDVGHQADHAATRRPTNSKGLRFGNYVQIRDVIDEEFQELLSGTKTAQQALDAMVAARQRDAPRVPGGQQLIPDPAGPAPSGAGLVLSTEPDRDRCRPSARSSPTALLPYLLLLPQLAITVVFFLWPAGQAFWQSFLREDPFGLKTSFVWFDNYARLFARSALSQFAAGHGGLRHQRRRRCPSAWR